MSYGKKITHIRSLSHRSGKMTITERKHEIFVELSFSKYGDFGDREEIDAWTSPLFQMYEADPRPFRFINPHSGEVGIIGNDFTAIIIPPK